MTAVRRVLAYAGAVLVFGACAGPSSGSATTTGSAGSAQPGSLRGARVLHVDCTVDTLQPDAANLLPSTPASLVLCPSRTALPSSSARPVELTPPPADLLAALGRADPPAPASPYLCPMYVDSPRAVYARLGDGVLFRLRLPEDGGCHHYLPAVLAVIARYAG